MSQSKAQVRYSTVAIVLHWVLMLAVIFMLFWGHYMGDLPKRTPEALAAIQLHKSIGLSILMLTLVRIIWRFVKRPPDPLRAGLKPWEFFAQQTVHWGFYALLLLLPLSGWIMSSANAPNPQISYFGLFQWPLVPGLMDTEDPRSIHEAFEEVHKALGWIMVALIVLHLAGVLKHLLILKDGILKRMWPG